MICPVCKTVDLQRETISEIDKLLTPELAQSLPDSVLSVLSGARSAASLTLLLLENDEIGDTEKHS